MIGLDLAMGRCIACFCADTVYPQDAKTFSEYIGVIGAAAIRIPFFAQPITGRGFSEDFFLRPAGGGLCSLRQPIPGDPKSRADPGAGRGRRFVHGG